MASCFGSYEYVEEESRCSPVVGLVDIFEDVEEKVVDDCPGILINTYQLRVVCFRERRIVTIVFVCFINNRTVVSVIAAAVAFVLLNKDPMPQALDTCYLYSHTSDIQSTENNENFVSDVSLYSTTLRVICRMLALLVLMVNPESSSFALPVTYNTGRMLLPGAHTTLN